MKEIPLSQGQFALVDDADYEWLSKYKWHLNKQKNCSYAMRCIGRDIKIKMHRDIMSVTDRSLLVDHIDGNGLNNQRNNLRICTAIENKWNQRQRSNKSAKSSSIYKGVSKQRLRWQANISIDKKFVYLGLFEKESDAALAYNEAAIKHFGEFARLNKVS